MLERELEKLAGANWQVRCRPTWLYGSPIHPTIDLGQLGHCAISGICHCHTHSDTYEPKPIQLNASHAVLRIIPERYAVSHCGGDHGAYRAGTHAHHRYGAEIAVTGG